MAVKVDSVDGNPKTNPETKRVLVRAERNDELKITTVVSNFEDINVPDFVKVVQRLMTYYGPKLRVEADDEQYLVTAPGPDTQALLWRQEDSAWHKAAEIRLDFTGSLPEYDICPDCGETLSTIAHERRAAIGACEK
ncbi:hypothetical protein [Halorussus salinus]|uniref:hypothetical protein n=1 Tax=Halorussus salinus TaxID=1364935 RepID=UPI0010924564|nr:hypothetical protein [Halorussus salinus]